MMNMMLAAAQVGTSLLQAREQIGAAGDQLGQTKQALVMERKGLELEAQQDARQRRQQLADTLAAQQSGLAASGVMGGRTARLLERDARMRASRERERAGIEEAYNKMALDQRESQAESAFKSSVRQAKVDMLAGISQAGRTAYTASQQNQVTEG